MLSILDGLYMNPLASSLHSTTTKNATYNPIKGWPGTDAKPLQTVRRKHTKHTPKPHHHSSRCRESGCRHFGIYRNCVLCGPHRWINNQRQITHRHHARTKPYSVWQRQFTRMCRRQVCHHFVYATAIQSTHKGCQAPRMVCAKPHHAESLCQNDRRTHLQLYMLCRV